VRLFAERLRELRPSRGTTQAELARQAEVAVPHLSELENADIAPGIDLGREADEAHSRGHVDRQLFSVRFRGVKLSACGVP
jgi:transcriptional regulator with XRE-family HTH domain